MLSVKLMVFLMISAGVAGVQAQSVFDMPRLFPQHRRYLAQFVDSARRGDLLGAETSARAAAKIFPRDANWHYNVACVCAKDKRPDEAMTWLEKAVDLGFTDLRQLQNDADLAILRDTPAFRKLIERAQTLAANPPANPTLGLALVKAVPMGNEALVDASDTQWDWNPASGGYMITLLRLVRPPSATADDYKGPYANLIAPWIVEGTAAGNAGDLYVNRDEDRTQIRFDAFPLLTPVVYSEEAQKAGAHLGAGNGLFSTGLSALPTVGNSILGINRPPFWRSLPRLIATEAAANAVSFRLATANQLYVYDATPDFNKAFKGDLLTSNSPQVVLSADLTSEKPNPKIAQERLTELILATLAAMNPETKAECIRRGLLVPTIQRLLRQHLNGVSDYLSAAAHPTVFDPTRINGEALIRAAHALTIKDLPPAIQLAVRQETMPRQYIDYFDAVTSESIVDSPVCVTRIVRGRDRTRRLTVEAAVPSEPGLSFKWVIVSGDPAKIRITPLTKNASLATLEVDYHAPYEKDGMPTRRVDIACVAIRPDGTTSAPVFVSLRSLANERRTYDAKGRIDSIDYTMPKSGFVYEDPALSAFKNWRDTYLYDAEGRCIGWLRNRAGEAEQRFDARGRRVVSTETDGTPKTVVNVTYMPRVSPEGDGISSPVVELLQSDAGAPFKATP